MNAKHTPTAIKRVQDLFNSQMGGAMDGLFEERDGRFYFKGKFEK